MKIFASRRFHCLNRKFTGVKSVFSVPIKGAMNFAKLSGDSFAMDFGETSPKMRTTTVDTAVDIPAPFDGNHSTKSRVAIEASRIFTMLFPISIVERSAS